MNAASRILRPAAVAIAVLASTAPARATDAPPERPWPVRVVPAVSSSFCEYRDGHLHAGLDIRTYGRVGVPCIAVEDGYVSRLRASPTGYGQVVYIQLDGGQTAVYAHLSEFAAALDSALYAEQVRLGRYDVDFRLPPGRLPVRRGQVVAWSGMTGADAPHLHFEVRDRLERPLDPFGQGFALTDTVPPVFRSVILLPLGPSARIDGACWPVERRARRTGPGEWVVDDTVSVAGPVGVSVLAYDLISDTSGRLAPRSLELSVDSTSVASVTFARFSFDHADQVGFVYDVGEVRTEGDHFLQLFQWPGETLGGREFTAGGRLPAPAGGVGEARVVARDHAGNASTLHIPLRAGAGAAAEATSGWRGPADGVFAIQDLIAVRPGRSAAAALDTSGHRLAAAGDGVWAARAEGLGSTATRLPGREGGVFIAGLHAGRAEHLDFAGLGLALSSGEGSLAGDAAVFVERYPKAPAPGPGLARRTSPLIVGPYSLPLRADVVLSFSLADPDSDDAVYRLGDSGTWVYYASRRGERTVSTTARRPGVYAVMADRTPPAIGAPRVVRHLRHSLGRRIPMLIIPVVDRGSGVDERRCTVYVGGVAQIARWDGFSKKLFVLIRDENIMGAQAVTVVTYDNIGHRSELDTRVDIPRARAK